MKKNYNVLIFLLCIMIIIIPVSANNNTQIIKTAQRIMLGEGTFSERTVEFENRIYPLYSYLNTDYIPVSYCESMGAKIDHNDAQIAVELTQNRQTKLREEVDLNQTEVYMYDKTITIGGIRSYGLLVGETVLIPVEALQVLWDVVLDDQHYSITYKNYYNEEYITIDSKQIKNKSDYPITIEYQDFYWNGESFENKDYKTEIIMPHTIQERTIAPLESKDYLYLTTIIEKINGIPTNINTQSLYGQKNNKLFKQYYKKTKLKELERIFPPYIVTATMKYNTGSLKENEIVEVWRAERREYYVVKDNKGKYIRVGQDSLKSIQDPGGSGNIPTTPQIELYVNLKELTSDTQYLVWTDIYRQRTYVFKGEKENWKLEKSFLCSTGINTRLTPRGFYKLNYKIPYFGVEKGFRCKNGVVIFRDYMYHSILFDATGHYVKEGLYQLGQRVSHGCIRMSEEDSKWFYQTLPMNTTVWIN